MPSNPYTRAYYRTFADTSLPSARCVVPWLLQLCPCSSVVDVGCGNGTWLSVFLQSGVSNLLGLDGDWVAGDQLQIPADRFRRASLELALPQLGRFDMALNLEVAEHLSPARADSLVADLCSLAPLVVFSAAVPHQGGAHHVNEQWPAYWWEKFQRHGYDSVDALRPRFWNEPEVNWCYKQNLLLYVSREAEARWPGLTHAPRLPGAPPLALVHPERFAMEHTSGIGHWSRRALPALRRTLRRHWRPQGAQPVD